jgi:general secretion pathway protein G
VKPERRTVKSRDGRDDRDGVAGAACCVLRGTRPACRRIRAVHKRAAASALTQHRLFFSQHAAPAFPVVTPVTPSRSSRSSRPSGPSGRSGFTLIELVITVAIVGILASAALPLTHIAIQRGKEQELRTSLRQIRDAIDAYKLASDEGRIETKADESGYPPKLEVLVSGVDDIKKPEKPKIYFLRRLPRDPLAPDTVPAQDTWGKRSYESPPENPREGKDVFDVYSKSEGTGLNGVPYREW